jgi:hypothetical protein
MSVYEDILDTIAFEKLQPDCQHRLSADRQQAFGCPVRVWPEPSTESGRQKESFHCIIESTLIAGGR